MSQKLFNQFSSSTRSEWQEEIKKVLKGKPLSSLDWEGAWDVFLNPFYMQEDFEPGELKGPITEKSNWKTAIEVHGPTLESVKEITQFHLNNGADAFHLCFRGWHQVLPNGINRELFREVMSLDIPIESTVMGGHFVAGFLQDFLDDPIPGFKGTFAIDPYFNYQKLGRWDPNICLNTGELVANANSYRKGLAHVAISGDTIQEGGASIPQEIGSIISMLVDYLAQDEFAIDSVMEDVRIYVSVGDHFFPELAKIRALRLLLGHIGEAYDFPEMQNLPIICRTSIRSLDGGEPHNNLLRATTETASAVMGGADVMAVRAHDLRNKHQSITNSSLSRNISLILKEESYLNRVADPGAGSWYIEKWTKTIMEEAWKNFLRWEEIGGFFQSFRHGYIQEEIEEVIKNKNERFSQRKTKMVGVNDYPPGEYARELNVRDAFSGKYYVRIQEITKELEFYFKGRPIGLERKKAIMLAYSKHKKGEILLVPFGDKRKAAQMVNYAKNYLGCIGYQFAESDIHGDLDFAEDYLKENETVITVLCAGKEDCLKDGRKVLKRLRAAYDKSVFLLAGIPDDVVPFNKAGIDAFVYPGRDMGELFERLREAIGQTY